MSDAPVLWALDISKARTGFVEGRAGEVPHATSIVGSGLDDVAASTQLFCYLRDRLKLGRPDKIFYEAPLNGGILYPEIDKETGKPRFKSSPTTVICLAKMLGAVELFASLASIPAQTVHVQTARVEFIGHGNLGGDEAKRRTVAMCGLLGIPVSNHDEADAVAVHHYGTLLTAKRLARAITPMMHAKVATAVSGVDTATPLFRRRA